MMNQLNRLLHVEKDGEKETVEDRKTITEGEREAIEQR